MVMQPFPVKINDRTFLCKFLFLKETKLNVKNLIEVWIKSDFHLESFSHWKSYAPHYCIHSEAIFELESSNHWTLQESLYCIYAVVCIHYKAIFEIT